jgi:hypothetical protein
MCSHSGLTNYLRDHSQGPQATGGTKWVLISSIDDYVISYSSAVDMDNARAFVFWYRDDNENGGYDPEVESCTSGMGHMEYFEENGVGPAVDSCFVYDYGGKRNMFDRDVIASWDPSYRAIKLGLFEAVT